jgi:hypothetical protein
LPNPFLPLAALLFAVCLFAALRNELLRDQHSARRDDLFELLLNAANAGAVRLHAQDAVFNLHQKRIAGLQPHLPADCGRNDNAAILIDLAADRFRFFDNNSHYDLF